MKPQILFNAPPRTLQLAGDEVHVFCASLEQPMVRLKQLAGTLSGDEQQRAARFRFGKDRDLFIAGRGILREILGWLLRVKPAELAFSYSGHGKPHLAASLAECHLHFNVAHSDSLAVYAVSQAHEVGVDVEHIRPVHETEEIAAHFFSDEERKRWNLMPGNARLGSFFDCWVRKEAILKAHGEGISLPLNQTEVLFAGDFCTDGQFLLHSLLPATNYTAALAVSDGSQRICRWSFNGL